MVVFVFAFARPHRGNTAARHQAFLVVYILKGNENLRRQSTMNLYSLMIMFNAAVLLVVVVENANAFQNVGLLNQAISAWDGTCFMSVDELFFAVTNLLDSQQSLARMKQGLSFRMSPTSFYLNEEQHYQYDYESQSISNTISLTKQEQDLFALVKEVRDKYCPSTTIRVAGGWVRDKLLRKTTSHDIDFVLNDISGSEFARLFHRHVSNHSETIAEHQSAERSKHLQTASLQYRDFCIDFCHLRFEKYSPDSRVPEKTNRASPVEDAWRRDLTINSLFYNINTNQVEDWTEQGLQDLQLGVIATPVMRHSPLYWRIPCESCERFGLRRNSPFPWKRP